MHSEMVNFRASPQLVEALSHTATSEGVSVSELIRSAVEARVANSRVEPCALDPYECIEAAARGDITAQRAIADRAVDMAFDPAHGCDPAMALTEGLVFARLAAAQGNIGDQGRVIGMLSLFAEVVGEKEAAGQLGEAVARVALVADQGVGICDMLLPDLAQSVPPEVMKIAQHLQARIRDQIGEQQ